jgi:sec-independent protein translocase protein TatB
MFELSFAEIIVILLVALIVVGPDEIPTVVRSVVKFIRSFKHWASGVKQQISDAIEIDELQDVADEVNQISGKKFILDDNGDYREVYDIKEFIEDKKRAEAVTSPAKEAEHG